MEMSGPLVALGMVAMSLLLFGFVAYRINTLPGRLATAPGLIPIIEDHSSLDEDLKDILEFIPLKEVEEIIRHYFKYDHQMGETLSFINDQKKFIAAEFHRIPEFHCLIKEFEKNGLNTKYWNTRIQTTWKNLPIFVQSNPDFASGGLTGMISRILKIVPQEALHEFLKQKVKYSKSFRNFLSILRSPNFVKFCEDIEENVVLHRHYYWAKEAGLEITFAVELLRELYVYLLQKLV